MRALPRDVAGQTVARQIARSGMAIGANIEEAQGAHSRADFVRRTNIARAEAREALYWLRLIVASELVPAARLSSLVQEAEEIVKILVRIVKTARRVDGE